MTPTPSNRAQRRANQEHKLSERTRGAQGETNAIRDDEV